MPQRGPSPNSSFLIGIDPLTPAAPAVGVNTRAAERSMDSADCRANAMRCIVMATDAKDNKTQVALFKMADAWTKLALDLEANPKLRAAASEVPIKTDGRLVGSPFEDQE